METFYKKFKYLYLIPFLIFLNKHIFRKKEKTIKNIYPDKKIFFIIGSGRNGSTLLSLLLSRHTNIFLPPEQSVLPYSILEWALPIFNNWNQFYKRILTNYKHKNQNWNLTTEDFKNIEVRAKHLKREHRNASNIYRLIIRYYAKKISSSKNIFGDQTPNTTLFYKSVYNEFPNAKYIFLVRHPLDVVLSYSKMTKNPASNPRYASWKWNKSIEAYNWLKKQKNSNVLFIRYEDLVSDTESTIKKIFNFLDVDYQDIITPNISEKNMDKLGTKNYAFHTNLYKPINTRSIGKWKKELSKDIIDSVSKSVQKKAESINLKITE